jgi:hypothetical protein
MNTSLDELTITAYASQYDEETDFPPFALSAPPYAPSPETSLRHPVDYDRFRTGIKSSWQPFGDRGPRHSNYGLWDGTSLASGYEYYLLHRDFATYVIRPSVPGFFTQPDTKTHQIEFGPSTRWSRNFDTFVRYRVQFIETPLIGVSEYSIDDDAVLATFNSNQPEEVHSTDVGYTWGPYSNFMTTTQFTFRNSWHQSEFAYFNEDDYPMNFTVWYAPTHRLSLTGGYAYSSNWIDQDITLGANRGAPTDTERNRFNYGGENHLVSINANYAWSPSVQLVGGFEWNRGDNTFNVSPSPHPGVDWTPLEFLADVIVETQRSTAGIEWQPRRDTNVYLRYIYFDYDDISAGQTSGTAHMALAGATRTW